jgi:hypothetical protein
MASGTFPAGDERLAWDRIRDTIGQVRHQEQTDIARPRVERMSGGIDSIFMPSHQGVLSPSMGFLLGANSGRHQDGRRMPFCKARVVSERIRREAILREVIPEEFIADEAIYAQRGFQPAGQWRSVNEKAPQVSPWGLSCFRS